jgi:hypothetical protein
VIAFSTRSGQACSLMRFRQRRPKTWLRNYAMMGQKHGDEDGNIDRQRFRPVMAVSTSTR